MPTITYTTDELAALAHYAAQEDYGSIPAEVPTAAYWRAAEVTPLASILAKHKAGIEAAAAATDLSGYATTAALSSGLAGKADTTALSGYATTSALTAGLAAKADTSALSAYLTTTAAALAYQPLAANLTALAGLSTTGVVKRTGVNTYTAAQIASADLSDFSTAVDARITSSAIGTALGYTAANAAALNASNLTTGTVPDARFPATLPAASGANLTSLNGSNISSGTVAAARLGTMTGDSGSGGASGAVPAPAAGDAAANKFLKANGTWATAGGVSGLTTNNIPYAASATTFGTSKLTQSGTNGGTVTLYDDTATTGSTLLAVRAGAGQSGNNYFEVRNNSNSAICYIAPFNSSGVGFDVGSGYVLAGQLSADNSQGARLYAGSYDSARVGVSLSSGAGVRWCSGAAGNGTQDSGFHRAAAGTMAVNDGTLTGVGALMTKRMVAAKTAGYTVLATDSFCVFTNTGATGSVALTLPTPAAGMVFDYIVTAAFSLSFVATGSAAIRNAATGTAGAANGNVASSTVGTRVQLVAVSASEWSAVITGTATIA